MKHEFIYDTFYFVYSIKPESDFLQITQNCVMHLPLGLGQAEK